MTINISKIQIRNYMQVTNRTQAVFSFFLKNKSITDFYFYSVAKSLLIIFLQVVFVTFETNRQFLDGLPLAASVTTDENYK